MRGRLAVMVCRVVTALALSMLAVAPVPAASRAAKGTKAAKAANGYAATQAAARRGDAKAAFRLALMHLDGSGAPRKPTEAARYMKMAAERGHARAQYYLGTFYHEGTGVKRDSAAAALWIGKAAAGGDAEAQYAYGMVLLSGDGVPVDKVRAIEWLGKASRQGNEGARDVLQELVAFQGRPTEIRALEPSISAAGPAHRPEAGTTGARLEGKGVVLDQGEFSLKFSMPGLGNTGDPYRTTTDEKLWEHLQGGSFEIIYRPGK
ncbi:tetratricopeptide repeat protein [Geobacter sulfurreducens]|uniref:tetratricopeptide repeat protein n=1 Tax=Geobacter sulfurreducens TaxID=35554 RepID=UPI002572A6EC|nr:tetratricopeptide repeat protein [Geobacter sulfurreducens]